MFSPHFSKRELACPLTGEIKLQEGFIDDLEELRVEYGLPMSVTSGCRSQAHNAVVGGHPHSLHMIDNEHHDTDTCAVDISRPRGPDLLKLVKIAIGKGWSIGIADTFIHLDMRSKYTNRQPTIYTY